ncbi:cystathionine gamma-synthase [Arthrobacter alpinus]|uniref:homocysteine desulfhydrase n=1 Tax=Arthrobacter alpinus TaxID=656366 RepID=A0A0M4R168_9MICC|nr:PLP-dependent transferase [Arthrobacter alpinus]ALE93840.1 cystathionine gamma-synthase [Arthrobacter alpinus]
MTYEPSSHPDQLSPETIVVAAGRPAREHDAPVNPPIVLSSTYVGAGQVVDGDRAYGRYSNPTWDPLEEALSELEGATLPGLIFSSGLAAASAALSLIPVGGVLVMPKHSYQGALVMAQEQAAKGMFVLRTVDIANNDDVIAALTGSGEKAADMLWLESPTNPMLEIADLRVLCSSARAVGAVVVTDNTFCTPLVQTPLELGADIVLHSVTKYLAGHSDVILGAVVTSNPQLRQDLHHHRSIHGAIAGPFEAWLALRGLRTLALRVERSQATALELARRLEMHDGVERVLFPGLSSDPGHERAKAQMLGFGSIICVEVAGGESAANAVVEALRLWTPATSLGGVESLIERRRRHANEPDTVPLNLLRLSVGIENLVDLWNDLAQALEKVAAES